MFNSNKPIIQIAYGVEDIVTEAEKWSKRFNIGPFYYNEHIEVSDSRINGIEEKFDHFQCLSTARESHSSRILWVQQKNLEEPK